MAGKREISFLITGDAKSLAAAAAKAEAELTKLDNFKLKAKELGINYDSKHVQDQLAKINDLKLATKYARVDADVKAAEAEIQKFIDGTNVKTQKLSAIRMEIDRRHLDEQLAAAEKELSKLGTEAQQAFKVRMDGIGSSLTNVGKMMSVGVTAPIVAGFGLATNASSDLGEALDYTNRLLPEGAAQIHAFGETAAQTFGLSKTEVEKYAQSYATMLKGAGMGMEEVTEKSLELIKRTSDIGSALNLTNDEVAAKLKSGLAGETEALRSIGIVIDEDTKKRYAWSKGIAEQGKNLTAQQKVIATFGLIMEKTTDQAGNFGDTIGTSLPNQMKASKAAAENTAASFGESLKPVMAEVFGVLGKVTSAFGELTAGQKQAIIYAGGLLAAIGPIVSVAGNVAKAVGGINTSLNVFRTFDANGAIIGLTGIGKAAAGLGIVGAVAGSFLLLNTYMEAVEKRQIAQKFNDLQKALNNPNAISGEIVKVAEAFAQLEKATQRTKQGKSLIETFIFGDKEKGEAFLDIEHLKKDIGTFNKAIDQMLEGGNTAGVQKYVDELKKFKDLTPELAQEIAVLEKKIKDYQQALYDAEVQQKASDEMNKKALETKRLEYDAEQKRIGAVKEWASATINAMTNVMRTEEQKEALAAKLTDNEKARYKGRDADLKAMEAAMPAARKWVQEQLDADEKVAESRKKLDAVKKESAKEEKAALKDISDARKDAAEQHEKDLLNQYNVYKEGKAAIKKAMEEEADVVEKAKAKETKAADDAAKIIKDADDKIIDAEGKMVSVIHDGSAKIEEAKRKVKEAMAESDAAIIKASNDYQQQLVENDRNIEKSKDRLAEVIRDTDRDILEAQRDVTDAVKDAAQDVQDAQKDVEETSIDTARNIADAEKDLARAIEDGAEKIADAKKSAAEAAEDAAQRILDAEERLTGDRTDNAEAIADAVKDQAKVEREGRKDVARAEEDYAKAVAKSGSNSEEAQNAAERLQEVRERAAENNEKAAERIAELQDRAAKNQLKNEKDLQKAKDDAAKQEIENADRIADAERDAARQIEDANTRKDRAIQDGIAANQAAVERLNRVQLEGNAKVIEAEENLRLTRERADRERDEATREHRRVEEVAEAERIEKSNEVARVVKENEAKVQAAKDAQASAEKQWQIDLTEAEKNLKKAHADRETALREANKLLVETQKQNVKDIATAHTNLEATIKKANENNRAAIDTTAKNAETAAGKISKLLETLDGVRTNSAEKIKTAEGGVTDAINDQKAKWADLKVEFDKFDVPTQKAIRSQIALIKGGKIEDGKGDLPSGGLEAAMNDLIGNDGKGIKGITKAINDIPPTKNIDIKVTVNGKYQTIDQAVGGVSGGGGASGSFDGGDNQNPGEPQFGPNPTGTNVVNVPGIGPVYVDPSWGGGNLNNGAAVSLGGVNSNPGEGEGNTNPNAFNGAKAGGSGTVTPGTPVNVEGNVGVGSNSGGSTVDKVIAEAKKQLGKPYVYGAKGPNSFDCSGLTWWAYKYGAGIDISQGTANQINSGVAASKDDIRAGDLVFWRGGQTSHDNGHVVLAISGTQCISAPHTGANVQIQTINKSIVQTVRRIIGGANAVNAGNSVGAAAGGIGAAAINAAISPGGDTGNGNVNTGDLTVGNPDQPWVNGSVAPSSSYYGGTATQAKQLSIDKPGKYIFDDKGGVWLNGKYLGQMKQGGGASVDLSQIPAGGIPTIGGIYNGILATATTNAGGINGAVTQTRGTVKVDVRVAPDPNAAERSKAYMDESFAMEELIATMKKREAKASEIMAKEAEGRWSTEEKIAAIAEFNLLVKQQEASEARVIQAHEARIYADRKAGVQTEDLTKEQRSNGLELEKQILKLRQDAAALGYNGPGGSGPGSATNATAPPPGFDPQQDFGAQGVFATIPLGGYAGATGASKYDPYGLPEASVPAAFRPAALWADWQERRFRYLLSAGFSFSELMSLNPPYKRNGEPPAWWRGPNEPVTTIGPDEPQLKALWDKKNTPAPTTPTQSAPGPTEGSSGIGTGTVVGGNITGRQSNGPNDPTGAGGNTGGNSGGGSTSTDTGTGSGSSDSSGSGSTSSDDKGNDMVEVRVLAPFIFQLDGKSIAEGIYEYTKLIARRNGDFTSDGTWRVTRK